MKNWDYANLSKLAKNAGGPEKYVNDIEKNAWSLGRKEGQESMLPLLIFVTVVYGGIELARWIKKHVKEKRLSQIELERAKAELIQGIKDYDKAHPEVEESECKETKGE